MKGLNHLVGLPWGFGAGQTDCLRLALAAHKAIFGEEIPLMWSYTPENYEARTRDIEHELKKIAYKIAAPEPGAVVLFDFSPVFHLGTFVDVAHFLHIPRNSTSRLTRWSAPYHKITVGIYRIGDDYIRNSEVRTW